MATYCDPVSGSCSLLSPEQYVNSTTYEWRIDCLPSGLTIINGTLDNNTVINGQAYDGIIPNGTVVIERVQPLMIGSLSIVSFIYMIMTFSVFLIMAYTVIGWIQAAAGQHQYDYTFFLPTAGALTERQFNKQLRRHYPQAPRGTWLPSYAETSFGCLDGDSTSEGLREFKGIIREKYAYDVRAWNARFVGQVDQPKVEDMRRRSRGATIDMMNTVRRWKEARDQWSPEEWDQVEEIYTRINQLHQAEEARYPQTGGMQETSGHTKTESRWRRYMPGCIN